MAFCIPPLTALASPSDQVAADQKALDAAVQEFSGAQNRINQLQKEINNNNAQLDSTLALELSTQTALLGRLEGMYRGGDVGILDAILGAQSFNDFVTRWDLFTRITEADAKLLNDLEKSRRQIESAANLLMAKQVEILEENARLEANMKAAQVKFSRSKTLLDSYNKRIADEKKGATNPSRNNSSGGSSSPVGTGEWKVSVASHYSWNFGASGKAKGASGKPITPTSMMVAHKTLPFGTKVEFEYKGRYAVASVEDRGPHTAGREWDLGPGTARALNFTGVGEVKWRILK